MKFARAVLALLLTLSLVLGLTACSDKKSTEKPWLKSTETSSQAGLSSHAVGESGKGQDDAITSEPVFESTAPSVALETNEVSEEDKQQSVYWNGLGNTYYEVADNGFEVSTGGKFSKEKAVEAWGKTIELDPKNMSPYLSLLPFVVEPESIDDMPKNIFTYLVAAKYLCAGFRRSGLEEIKCINEEEMGEDGIAIRFDSASHQILIEDGDVECTLTFDQADDLIEYRLHDGETSTVTFQYDDAKKLMQYLEAYGEDIHTYSFTYDESGNVIHCSWSENGELLEEWGYKYTADGLLAEDTWSNGDTTYVTNYEYDSEARLVKKIPHNGISPTEEYEYDENGKWLDDPFNYDEKGYLISRTSDDGSVTPYTYDPYGNFAGEAEEYDSDGNPTRMGDTRIQYVFAE